MPDNLNVYIRDIEELIQLVESGKVMKYLFFWGHRPAKDGSVSKSCLSNWYPAPFISDTVTFPTTEHYMMAKKALLFEDWQSYQRILHAQTPEEAKALGRNVNRFSDEVWNLHRKKIVVAGNTAKFSQHPELKRFLLSTQKTILVEASPYDPVWGIGMAEGEASIADPRAWKGLNLLGFVLMEVRDQLSKV